MSIRCCIHQPEHLSYPGFWAKLLVSDVWIALDTAQYLKSHYHNRNRIKGPAGWQWLTVPVIVPHHKSPINSVIIAEEFKPDKHLATIAHAYHAAPSFDRIQPIINEAFQRAIKHRSLSVLNLELIENIARYLGIHRTIIRASYISTEKHEYNKNQRLINLCNSVSASTYICGAGSKSYMDYEMFASAGIAVEQIEYTPNYYPRTEPFQSNLSIVDLLMYSQDTETVINHLRASLSRISPEIIS